MTENNLLESRRRHFNRRGYEGATRGQPDDVFEPRNWRHAKGESLQELYQSQNRHARMPVAVGMPNLGTVLLRRKGRGDYVYRRSVKTHSRT